MNKIDIKKISLNAMVMCVYAVLTIVFSGLSYGGIQFRFSEIFIFLASYNKKYIPGLVAGCFLANLSSPLGIIDICFGTIATFIACVGMNKIKSLFMGAFFASMVNGIIVGYELYYVFNLPFLLNSFYVFIGEFTVLMFGVYIFKKLEKNNNFMEKYIYWNKL